MKKNRILFIDLLRAFAVLMMVQGHTIDVFLRQEYRTDSYLLYYLWNFMRGLTAPIFMFSSGTVFSYLFKFKSVPFNENPRVKKGIKRFFTLLFWGYLLRYPSYGVVVFDGIGPEQWKTFFSVDVLQLIGSSLLIVVLLEYLHYKFRLNIYYVFIGGAAFFFFGSLVSNNVQWLSFLPIGIADYFTNLYGSNFPLFPWAGFVICGGLLGNYLADYPMIFQKKSFVKSLMKNGLYLIIVSFVIIVFINLLMGSIDFWNVSISVIFLRMGLVLLLTSLIVYSAQHIQKMPKIVILLGQNTLLIYIVHVSILYGNAWIKGINQNYGNRFSPWFSVVAAVTLIVLMTIMVIALDLITPYFSKSYDKIKTRFKNAI